MKRTLRLLLLVLMMVCCARTASGGEATALPARIAPTPPLEDGMRQSLLQGVKLGADYLLRNCDSEGRFTYLRHTDPAMKAGASYNLLRHCGTVYALGMLVQAQPERMAEVRPVISRACEFLRVNGFLSALPGEEQVMAIWEIPGKLKGRAASGAPVMAKLGGAGLGLLALLADYRSSAGEVAQTDAQRRQRLEEMRGLGRFILQMQLPDGAFYSRYVLGKGVDDSWYSLYYPGEAMLGLVELYRVDPDPQWLKAAALGMHYLARGRKVGKVYPADHWALLASAQLLKELPALEKPPVRPDEVIEHAIMICLGMIGEQVSAKDSPGFGSFREGGQTCPTAIRVEGMLAAREFLPAGDTLRTETVQSSDLALQFLLRAQIKEGELAGGMPRAICRLPEPAEPVAPKGGSATGTERKAKDAAGATDVGNKANDAWDDESAPEKTSVKKDDSEDEPVNPRRDNQRMGEIRVDYVQHALSAMLMRLSVPEDH